MFKEEMNTLKSKFTCILNDMISPLQTIPIIHVYKAVHVYSIS